MDDGSDVLLNFLHNQLETMINVQSLPEMTKCLTHRGGGGGTWDFANPTHATMPTARIIHPNMSYLRSLLFFFFEDVCNRREKSMLKLQVYQLIKKINNNARRNQHIMT